MTSMPEPDVYCSGDPQPGPGGMLYAGLPNVSRRHYHLDFVERFGSRGLVGFEVGCGLVWMLCLRRSFEGRLQALHPIMNGRG